jgi:hypothetical protein
MGGNKVFRLLKIVNKDVISLLYSAYNTEILPSSMSRSRAAQRGFSKNPSFPEYRHCHKKCACTVRAAVDNQDCPDRATSRPPQFDQDVFKIDSFSALYCTARGSR